MRKIVVSEFMSLDGMVDDPGGAKGERGGAPGATVGFPGSRVFPSTGTVFLTYGQGS